MKRLWTILLFSLWSATATVTLAVAGGNDGHIPMDTLPESAQRTAPTAPLPTVKDWLNKAERRIVEIEILKHEQEISRIQAEIGAQRKRCRDIGYDCPLVDYQPRVAVDDHNVLLPEVQGIVGGKVCFMQGKQCIWKRQGETYQGFTLKEIGLDQATVTTKDGTRLTLRIKRQ